MYVDVIIRFISDKRASLPKIGYRPDIVIDGQTDYWGVTFIHLEVKQFDIDYLAKMVFTFQEAHYHEIEVGQSFIVKEGPHSVAEGTIKLIHF